MKINGLGNPYGIKNVSNKTRPDSKGDFMDLLKKEISSVDAAQKVAAENLKAFATGENPDLTALTLSLTKADLSFRLLLQVRNKVLQAYEEVMRMQL
ncbi:flagellar hook-basal body complex subunit FliE [Thermodesulfatator indicus DSM 15286]|uniref:Flagellar hook-basal body complex protein FliE n=1 Tax=Thermodesulfatator indicus (strain DSM 15286 / JCM 11887 / CIR29812) TaxID=667014 RepID=F8ABX4_THEID|nr:flagellar hook-basal body complex protein FliE [Thermodesulfatator indicus]AEH45666.1 flagellar hook-basal body complex subunit FliE [Thermodesulfatator indicus DSM 15286]